MGMIDSIKNIFKKKQNTDIIIEPTGTITTPSGEKTTATQSANTITRTGANIPVTNVQTGQNIPLGTSKVSRGGGGRKSNLFTPSQNNTYDTSTSTYTDSSGNKTSTATIPASAKITDSKLTGTAMTKTSSSVNSFVASEKAKDVMQQKSQAESSANLFIAPKSKKTDVFLNSYYNNQQSKIKSMAAPSTTSIVSEFDNKKLSASDASFAFQRSNQQKYESYRQQDFDKAISFQIEKENKNLGTEKYQARIDSGEDFELVKSDYEKDVSAANLRLSDFSSGYGKKWYDERGKFLEGVYAKQNFNAEQYFQTRQTQRNVKSYFIEGGIFGAGATGAGMGVGALSKTAGAAIGTVGSVVGAGYAVYAYGKSGFAGKKTYEQAISLGFTKKEALQYGLLSGANDIAPSAFSAAGATAGGFAVYGATVGTTNYLKTGSLRGITAKDQEAINKAVGRKNAFETKLIKGKVTDTSTGRFAAENDDLDALGLTKSGRSVRKFNTVINEKGLSSNELKAIRKLNFRAETYQVVNQNGKSVSGFELTKIKTGKFLSINKEINSIGYFKGNLAGNKFSGNRLVYSQQGKDTTVSLENIFGKGNVRYASGLRGEVAHGGSVKVFEAKYQNGKLFDTSDELVYSTSKFGVVSKLFGASINAKPYGKIPYQKGNVIKTSDVFDLSVSKTYKDLFGAGFGGKPKITYNLPKPPRPSKSWTNGKDVFSGGMLKTVSAKSLPAPVLPSSPKSQSLNNFIPGKGYASTNIPRMVGLSIGFNSRGSSAFDSFIGGIGRGFNTRKVLGKETSPQVIVTKTSRGSYGRPTDFSWQGSLTGGLLIPKNRFSGATIILPDEGERTGHSSNNSSGYSFVQVPKQKLKQELLPKQMQRQRVNLKPAPFYPKSNFNFAWNPGKLIVALPNISLFDYGFKRGGRGKGRNGRYAPNIAAIGFNIKSLKIPKSYSRGFGALTLRPVIGRNKSGRKKSNAKRRK